MPIGTKPERPPAVHLHRQDSQVKVDVSGELIQDDEAVMRVIMERQ